MNSGPSIILYLNQTAKVSGAEISLLSLMTGLDKRFRPKLALPEEGPLLSLAKEAGIEVSILPGLPQFGESNQLKKLIRIIRSAFQLKKRIKQEGIRLVHANSPRIGYAGGLAARLASVPSIIHVRDIYLSPLTSRLKSILFNFLADKIIAVSEATARSIIAGRKTLARKTLVIHNGIDLEKIDALKAREIREELKIEKEAPLIGFAGILHPVKGIEIFIRAAPIISEEFPSAKFLIIGDIMSQDEAGYLNRLKAMVRELSLEGKVFFLGFQKEAPGLIKSLDILVHPALYPEPLPRVILEAAACRRPIVAASVGGVPEIIDDGLSGFLFKPGDVESLARHCLHLLKNRDLARQLGEQARRKIEQKFTIKRHCQQIASLYEELMEKRK